MADEPTDDGITSYGFTWGQVRVERVTEIDGRKVLRIVTPYREVQVYASATGRSVRVWRDHEELTAARIAEGNTNHG